MSDSAHLDRFALDHLPPRPAWPEMRFDLPELEFPPRLNCARVLLDEPAAGEGRDRPAILFPGGSWSCGELLAQANRVAQVLVEDLGVVPGNRVLLRAQNNAMFAACWFGALKAGAVVVPTIPLLRAAELVKIVNHARISHALCDARLAAELRLAQRECPSLAQLCCFNGERLRSLESLMQTKSGRFESVDTAAEDVAMIAYTSGTTGAPKGTMHFHRDVLATCEGFPRHVLRQRADDIVAGTPSLAFTYGLGGLLHFPLRYRAASLLLERFTPESLLEAVARHRVTVLYSGPTTYRQLAEIAGRFDLSSLRACVSAGEALPVPTRAAWERATGVRIIDGIGSSEMLYIFISAAGDAIRPGATGKVLPGYQATVLDPQGRPAPAGTVGRLAVKGPTGCRYLADERQASYVQNGWNVTGDAYRMDEDGYFYYQARADDMIISAGYNIAGPEVEAALLAHPAVAECAVIGVPDAARGNIVKACVVLRPGYAPGEALVAELQIFVKQQIAPYKYPRAIEFYDSLPRTTTGKLQRFRLRAGQS